MVSDLLTHLPKLHPTEPDLALSYTCGVLRHGLTLCGFTLSVTFGPSPCGRKTQLFGHVVSRIALGVSLCVHYIAFFLEPHEFALKSADR